MKEVLLGIAIIFLGLFVIAVVSVAVWFNQLVEDDYYG